MLVIVIGGSTNRDVCYMMWVFVDDPFELCKFVCHKQWVTGSIAIAMAKKAWWIVNEEEEEDEILCGSVRMEVKKSGLISDYCCIYYFECHYQPCLQFSYFIVKTLCL